MWQGAKTTAKGLGNALEIAGAIMAVAGMYEDMQKCSCDE
jgi:hypothetical protein